MGIKPVVCVSLLVFGNFLVGERFLQSAHYGSFPDFFYLCDGYHPRSFHQWPSDAVLDGSSQQERDADDLDIYLGRNDVANAKATLENILRYSTNTNNTVNEILVQVKDSVNSNESCVLIREILKYYPGELAEIKDLLVEIAYKMISKGFFSS